MNLRRLRALAWKESLQILRDPSSILIAFVLPLILLFIFGYGLSLDATELRLGVVVEAPSAEARSLAASFSASRYFRTEEVPQRQALAGRLAAGDLHGVLVIPADFAARLSRGDAVVQLVTDGSQPNTASFVSNYAEGVWRTWARQRAQQTAGSAATSGRIEAVPRYWYNPAAESRNVLVPGSVAIVMTLIGALLTALVVAREWERGTMEALLATSVTRGEFVAGKLIPYYLLGMGSMLVSTLVAVALFEVPFRGSLGALALVSTCFLLAVLGLGLMISSLARNQFVTGQIALMAAFLPAFLLSGLVFEIASMPLPIQGITYLVPARYFVACLTTLFLAGDVWSVLMPAMGAMLAIASVFFSVVALKTPRSLES